MTIELNLTENKNFERVISLIPNLMLGLINDDNF